MKAFHSDNPAFDFLNLTTNILSPRLTTSTYMHIKTTKQQLRKYGIACQTSEL